MFLGLIVSYGHLQISLLNSGESQLSHSLSFRAPLGAPGTLQYIPCSLLVTVAGVVGKQYGCYHEGRFAVDDVYLYCIIIRNWSQCWALYCLGLVYVALHDELGGMKPLLKFSAIKLVVLFMWYAAPLITSTAAPPPGS